MIDVGKLVPEHIFNQLSARERKAIARTYIYALLVAALVGAMILASGYIGKRWLLPSDEWTVLEFGRYKYGSTNQTCRLGEIILTSETSDTHSPAPKVKLVAGYANVNEKFWVETRTDKEQVTLLGANGVFQVFKAQPGDPTLFLLERYEEPDGKVRPGTEDHYLRKVFKPGVLKGIVQNTEYLVSNTCPGFQSRD